MSQKGFRYDMNRCLECRACAVSCKDKNDLPVGVNYIRIREDEEGKFPNVFVWFTMQMCRHCSDPACVRVCPSGAMQKDGETGVGRGRLHRLRPVRPRLSLRRGAAARGHEKVREV